jgi:hypothetical protein
VQQVLPVNDLPPHCAQVGEQVSEHAFGVVVGALVGVRVGVRVVDVIDEVGALVGDGVGGVGDLVGVALDPVGAGVLLEEDVPQFPSMQASQQVVYGSSPELNIQYQMNVQILPDGADEGTTNSWKHIALSGLSQKNGQF